MSYTKQGINYGIGQQSTAQIDADLTYLRTHFDFLRVTYPDWDSTSVPYWQDICERAKAKGFYVMWGINCPNSDGLDWFKFLQKFIDLASWAAANSVVLGVNEEMWHNDNSKISDAAALSSLHAAAHIAKLKHPTVKLAISLQDNQELAFFMANSAGVGNNGRGDFDFVCPNQYDNYSAFTSNINAVTAAYNAACRVTEFNIPGGFDPATGDEASWKADIKARADYMSSTPVSVFYFYTYYHNPEMTTGNPSGNKWDMRTNANNVTPATHHTAWDNFKKGP